jgi:hypothetical protein
VVKFPTAMDACGMNINSMPVLVVEAISPEKASQMRIHN